MEPTRQLGPAGSTAYELALLHQRVIDSEALATRQAGRTGDLERYVRVLHEAIRRFELQRRAGDISDGVAAIEGMPSIGEILLQDHPEGFVESSDEAKRP